MTKLRTRQERIKVSGKSNEPQQCFSEQYPWFSFRYMTTNANYTLDHLPSGNNREQTLLYLLARLEELSSNPWRYWMQKPKQTGLETISYDQLNFSPNPAANLSKDSTLYVFRFDTYKGAGKGRIIGFKSSPCAVLHIIGYDFDFSAYKHS